MPSLTTVTLVKGVAFSEKKSVHTRSPSPSSLSFLDITYALQRYLSFPLSFTSNPQQLLFSSTRNTALLATHVIYSPPIHSFDNPTNITPHNSKTPPSSTECTGLSTQENRYELLRLRAVLEVRKSELQVLVREHVVLVSSQLLIGHHSSLDYLDRWAVCGQRLGRSESAAWRFTRYAEMRNTHSSTKRTGIAEEKPWTEFLSKS